MTVARVAGCAAAALYAALLANTRPFSAPADGLTALGLAVGAVALVLALTRRQAGDDRPAVVDAGGSTVPWLVLVTVAVGWELYCFFGGPRPAHPTLSSLYDIAARWPAAKAAVVLAWLALGRELVRR